MFWNRKKNTLNKNSLSNGTVENQASTRAEKDKQLPLSFLKRLIPICRLTDADLLDLKATISRYKPGDVIFKRNEPSELLSYIVKGHCFLESNNGSGYDIEASTFKSYYPLSSDYHNHCSAIAKSDVHLIHFPLSILQKSNPDNRNPLLNIEDIPDNCRDNQFFNAFCQQFKQDKLIIPSLPDVALKLRSALQKDIGVKEAVTIINFDPAIASKLIQIVNSPLYQTVNPITTCHDAVTRLGLTVTRNLVTSISMKNLFRSKNRALNNRIHHIWKQGVQVSSISQALAVLSKQANPDEALLAGLVHNIGALPVIIFADSLNKDDYSEQDLNLTISTLQGLLGNIILDRWDFQDISKKIPRQIENWYHKDSEQLQISDIVLLAKFHSYLGSPQMKKLPPIQTLPAFQKLGDNMLTPDMSLQTLHDAKQQISEARSLFGG